MKMGCKHQSGREGERERGGSVVAPQEAFWSGRKKWKHRTRSPGKNHKKMRSFGVSVRVRVSRVRVLGFGIWCRVRSFSFPLFFRFCFFALF